MCGYIERELCDNLTMNWIMTRCTGSPSLLADVSSDSVSVFLEAFWEQLSSNERPFGNDSRDRMPSSPSSDDTSTRLEHVRGEIAHIERRLRGLSRDSSNHELGASLLNSHRNLRAEEDRLRRAEPPSGPSAWRERVEREGRGGGGRGGRGAVNCFNCGRSGHVARECPIGQVT